MYRTRMHIFIFLLCTILIHRSICEQSEQSETIEVKLKQGLLSGKQEKTIWNGKKFYAFRGVPFAEPPVGALRFQPPQPLKSWTGTYESYENKPTCVQFSTRERNNEPIGVSGSEDCLYISIYTPNLEGNYPVIVFDYNDNFRTGFNGTDTYSPDFFIEEDVIVVTISHRLGIFGYLTTDDDVIPANNGLRDFILGLNWIKDNIKLFGGDPNTVTLMGNSGGAALINILLYSEQAKGLFSAVILQSGTALETIYFFPHPRDKAFEFGKALDIEASDSVTLLNDLQKVDFEKLLIHEGKVLDSNHAIENQIGSTFPFVPIVEKESSNAIISSPPETGKIVNDVPVIIGLTSREGIDIASHFLFQPKLLEQILSDIRLQLPIKPGFRFDPNSTIFLKDAARDVNEFYYKDGYLHLSNLMEYSTYLGDTQISYPVDYTAKKLANELKSPVYYYMFDFRGALNENSNIIGRYSTFPLKAWGATVTDELCYLFYCKRITKDYENIKKLVSEQREVKILKKMVKLWTNFAKIRNPTPKSSEDVLKGVLWQPMDKNNKKAGYLHIEKKLKMKKEPLGKRAAFWNIFLEKYGKHAVDGVVQEVDKPLNPIKLKNDFEDDEVDAMENFEFEQSLDEKIPQIKPKPKKTQPLVAEPVRIVDNHEDL